MSNAPSWTLVREKAEELKNRILSKFPSVDVEYADWRELYEHAILQARGFPPPNIGVNVYMLIRGDLDTAEKAATFADNEVARISEETGIEIQVQKTNRVWCKKSGMLEAQSVVPGQAIKEGPTLDFSQHSSGIEFWCFMYEEHEHDFGKFQEEYLNSLR